MRCRPLNLDVRRNAMADPQFIFKVEDTFTIRGRGVCAVGLRHSQLGSLRPGDRVELRRPDASVLHMEVLAVEWRQTYVGTPPPMEERRFPVLLSPIVPTSDVPAGSEIWLMEPAPDQPAQRTVSPPSDRFGLFKRLWRLANRRSL